MEALKIIHNLSGKRLDPTAAAAIAAIYGRGEIHIPRPSPPVVPVTCTLPALPSTPTPAVPDVAAQPVAVVQATSL
jgi:hypothetical protein